MSEALAVIQEWRPALFSEIKLLDPDIQFVHDPSARRDAIISFSDNATPGCLYVGIRSDGDLIDPYLLADSIIHEHRHQKLYLLQRLVPMLEADSPLVKSPWRDDLRPPSGLLHAIFVFVHLLEFWQFCARSGKSDLLRARAINDVAVIDRRLSDAFPVLRRTSLTEVGHRLTDILEGIYALNATCVDR